VGRRAVLHLLFLAAALSNATACAPPAPPRDLVLVSLDTVRADHLDAYGYARPTAPRLAELARGAWLFRNAYAQDANTGPSHATLFTGLYPPQHGAVDNNVRLPAGPTTLAEVLRTDGWATGAFVSGWPLRAMASALDRGFEVYDDELDDKRRRGPQTTERALAWWRASAPRRRFLFLHLYDAHGPYEPGARLARQFKSERRGPIVERLPSYQRTRYPFGKRRERRGEQEYVDAYDASIRELDERLAELLAEVDLRRAAVVVLADHGESLTERFWKFDHGGQAFEEEIRVPLVLAAPGLGARIVDDIVELVDVLPTLLPLLGVPTPPALQPAGHDLVAVVRRGAARPRHAFSSARALSPRHADRGYRLDRERRIHALRGERLKLIVYPGASEDYQELYDLAEDAGERRPLPAGAHPAEAARLARILQRYAATPALPAERHEPSAEDAANLRALGYLD